MAKPRVFVSSTYYDLKHIRSSIELFIESLGFEPVLSEKGDIAYVPDLALDESCYREAAASDIFVLIVGGRYGSEASGKTGSEQETFYSRYDSITRREFEVAYESNVPVFILIEAGVAAEYRTFLANKGNKGVKYAHVDSVNIFELIEVLSGKKRNNPTFYFERSSEIESWLRDQWAGLFRELLRDRVSQRQIATLTGQVGELRAVNDTLKNYLEQLLKNTGTAQSEQIIVTEEKRLADTRRVEALRANRLFSYLENEVKGGIEKVVSFFSDPSDVSSYIAASKALQFRKDAEVHRSVLWIAAAISDYNLGRIALNLPELEFSEEDRARVRSALRRRDKSSGDAPPEDDEE